MREKRLQTTMIFVNGRFIKGGTALYWCGHQVGQGDPDAEPQQIDKKSPMRAWRPGAQRWASSIAAAQ